MSKDISSILEGWEFEPEELQVRIVGGLDGRDKMQIRTDLGLIQLELTGRPDGTRPEGFDSLLEAHEIRAQEAGEEYALDSKACMALMREGIQYYHRYIAAFQLHRYDLVARDTERNLRLFAFVVKHATRQRDKIQFDQYRPYVTMMRSRALGQQALARNDHAAALAAVDEGIAGIRQFLQDYEQTENEAECMELGSLLRWRREVETERPVGPLERLEEQLALAVALENYEEAGRLRDQLQRLKGAKVATRRGSR
ncbi:MAG: UvrB/UvrC motif-containing protein [Isosphaeraceae bacterium]